MIQDNLVLGNAKGGITIGGGTVEVGLSDQNNGFNIIGNTIEGNGEAALPALIVFSAKNGTISGNFIINNIFDGLQINDEETIPSSNWLVENNICSNTNSQRTQLFGIRILGLSSDINLIGNTCSDNGADISGDGIVNILDFQILSNNFGTTGG